MGKTVRSVVQVSKEAATAEVVNSIKSKYPELRQESKAVTFAAQYQGTYRTFMNASGFSEVDAKALEANYKSLYIVSEQYTQGRLLQASKDGYAEVAFGLRIRTPIIKQVVWGSSSIPREAAAEGRTVGNALSQSYGLLNNRAANAFMQRVWDSKHRLDIKPIALVHDAIYLLIKDDAEVVAWVNEELIKAMGWQELPELIHTRVKLNAALDLMWPDWSNPITLPNGADQETIRKICNEAKEKYDSK